MPLQNQSLTCKNTHVAEVTIQGIGKLLQSRYHNEPKEGRESNEEYEKRTWKSRAHTQGDEVCIPARAIKEALMAGAARADIKTKGNATITKHFKSGVLIEGGLLPLGVNKREIIETPYLCPTKGQKGDAKKVEKRFPAMLNWSVTFELHIIDNIITKEILLEVLKITGLFNGLGSYRVQNGGENGRFRVIEMLWDGKPVGLGHETEG